jgi:cold shock CspA family protein/ribosome-associated translation inhibitor RaiA
MEVRIEGRHTQVAPDVQALIRQRLEELNTPHADILHARVTLVKHERHQHGSDEVHMFVTLSGKALSVTRTGDTLDDALYQALQVMSRELHDFRSIRQGTVKTPGPRPRGRIARLFPERGYGFIETESHREVYFHANAVHGLPFERLAVGMTVELDVEAGHAGPQASRVTLHSPPIEH